MRNNRGALAALTVLGGFMMWRNRNRIRRQFGDLRNRTSGSNFRVDEAAKSVASRFSRRMGRGATIAENLLRRRAG